MDEEKRKKFLRILEERTSVNSNTGCWEYQGVNGAGYGQVTIDGQFYYAHRLSAQLFLRYDPASELHVLHQLNCYSRACWNPNHLYLGTNEDNIRDTWMLGRGKGKYSDVTHCVNGHEFTEENTYWSQRSTGQMRRQCRTCRAIRDKEAKQRRGNMKIQTGTD